MAKDKLPFRVFQKITMKSWTDGKERELLICDKTLCPYYNKEDDFCTLYNQDLYEEYDYDETTRVAIRCRECISNSPYDNNANIMNLLRKVDKKLDLLLSKQ